MGARRKASPSRPDPRRRWLLAMHIWLAAVRDVDWVAASFGHS